jgi:hypothetical protein
MKGKNSIPARVDPEFKRWLDELRTERFRAGKDRQPKSGARISLALTRVPNLKKILMEARIDD